MERQTPVRNWRYVHHNRKQSEDSMDNSIDSVQSSKSGKFNRFQFKKEERPLPKEGIFALNSKNRERGKDPSLASKQSLRELDTSKLSENQPFLKGVLTQVHKNDPQTTPRQMREPLRKQNEVRQGQVRNARVLLRGDTLSPHTGVKQILQQVKGMTEEFKKLIGMFSKKYRDMRYEWDRSFKALLALQITQETQTIFQLKAQLQKKQEQLDRIIINPLEKQPPSIATSAVKPTDHRVAPNGSTSFQRLAISKVDAPKQLSTLSRNNTIADFLSAEAMRQREERAVGLEVRSLRHTIKRMQQILEQ